MVRNFRLFVLLSLPVLSILLSGAAVAESNEVFHDAPPNGASSMAVAPVAASLITDSVAEAAVVLAICNPDRGCNADPDGR